MMDLLYSALDIAVFISTLNLGCCAESKLLDQIWTDEHGFLPAKYRHNQRRFILDVRYWMDYFYDKPEIDAEFPAVQKDVRACSQALYENEYLSDFSDLDLFFKSIRLRILYTNGKDYVRMKIRTILREYGYQRRSAILVTHIDRCMHFYQIEATLRGGIPCDIATDALDNMVTFRII